ncbi:MULTISPECIES: HugZ family protein [Burkholderia]|uniref:HugZ family pyridoxamine 5'-phosphate oxidase n=1 Tax=Burkholderia TaxID=32008 RepID=UPI000841DB60|nr:MULTISPECIES: pyridoxamine 5'-phosphate oxidase family protein [unclassified Burkholderia]AOK28421.1 pyridoxamine 5'-phosphate oxidase [Burkholderia sp. Bp7605]
MNIPAVLPLHLLHRNKFGTLATQSRPLEGTEGASYPYPSVMPYALDAHHRPIMLVSGLAEHTRNFMADPRVGFLVADGLGTATADATESDVLDAERATLVGRIEPVGTDAHVAARYLRYHPDAARYLALGDFSFWALTCERLRYIGGFGRMGWLDAAALDPLAPVSYDDERALWDEWDEYAASQQQRSKLELLGVDRYGADWRWHGIRRRTPFDSPKMDIDALAAALREAATVSPA